MRDAAGTGPNRAPRTRRKSARRRCKQQAMPDRRGWRTSRRHPGGGHGKPSITFNLLARKLLENGKDAPTEIGRIQQDGGALSVILPIHDAQIAGVVHETKKRRGLGRKLSSADLGDTAPGCRATTERADL